MKVNFIQKNIHHALVDLKEDDWLIKQRVAGNIVANSLVKLENMVKAKSNLSMIEMNALIEEYILSRGAEITFKGYHGFPSGVCISVNKTVVHGFPTDYKLQEGDVVSFDLGATYEGAIADSAITCIYGEPKDSEHVRLLVENNKALYAGINAIEVGRRLGCIGEAIHNVAKKSKFSSIVDYTGHGISWNKPHAEPCVENKSTSYHGIRIQRGLSIAIEPQFVLAPNNKTQILANGWDIEASGISAHFEHSVFVHDDHVEIITDRNNL